MSTETYKEKRDRLQAQIKEIKKRLKAVRKERDPLGLVGSKLFNEVLHIMKDVEGHHCYGVAHVAAKYSSTNILYFNTGETYELTVLVYVGWERVNFKLGNYGDLIESGKYE